MISCKCTAIFNLLSFVILFIFLNNAFAHRPHDNIELLEISPNYDEDKTLFIHVRGVFKKSTDGGLTWKEIVNGLDHNYIPFSSIAVSPSFLSDQTVFLSSNERGIYKSVDRGNSWHKENNGLGDLSISLLSLSPNYSSDEIILAAGSEGALYKSKNGGDNFYQVIERKIAVTAIAFSPEIKKPYALIGDRLGVVYVSTNNGETWKQGPRNSDDGAITGITFSPRFSLDHTIFVVTKKGNLFQSLDKGISFERVNNDLLSGETVVSIAISSNYPADSIVYISTWYNGVFRSIDRGKSWHKFGRGLTSNPQADAPRHKHHHFGALKGSKNFSKDGTIFLAAFDGLFRSTNGGLLWKQLQTISPEQIEGIALSPAYHEDGIAGVSTYLGGVYLTRNRGITWEASNRGFNEIQLMDIAFSPNFNSDRTIFVNTNFDFYRSTDAGQNWKRVPLGYQGWRRQIGIWLNKLGFPTNVLLTDSERQPTFPVTISVSPDFLSDQTVYLGTRYRGVFRSVDSGLNWSPILRRKSRVTSLALSPKFASDKTAFLCIRGEGIYKTVDSGDTWEAVYLTKHHGIYLVVSPVYNKDRTVFGTGADGLMKTIDGGGNWESVGEEVCCGGNSQIRSIAISPNYENDHTVIVSVLGNGLFKSENGGRNFVETGNHLINDNYSLRFIKFSPSYSRDDTIYGASWNRLFQSTDGGKNWKIFQFPVRYENKGVFINFEGKWDKIVDKEFSAMKVHHSDVTGSRATLEFVGSSVSWIGTRSHDQGIAKVYIDGKVKDYVDQFSHEPEAMVKLYSVNNLPYGPHSITIEVTNTKNPKSQGYGVDIDAFDVKG